ncbi:hypothetical protein [Alysiella filiformis]|nr:hypothetical protein [Alysiella filiformis]QMT31523.1 hypothetical protein H3L97_01020 [Alysiella filiformis]UBQ55464.1 hypothetical protein JF568_07655 [Alysiella filiformis DSM 16848]
MHIYTLFSGTFFRLPENRKTAAQHPKSQPCPAIAPKRAQNAIYARA